MIDKDKKDIAVRQNDIKAVLEFVKITREGKLAPIDVNIMSNARVDYLLSEDQDEYYYSIS